MELNFAYWSHFSCFVLHFIFLKIMNSHESTKPLSVLLIRSIRKKLLQAPHFWGIQGSETRKHCFSVASSTTWSSIFLEIRLVLSFLTFQKLLKTKLFLRIFPWFSIATFISIFMTLFLLITVRFLKLCLGYFKLYYLFSECLWESCWLWWDKKMLR